jgi:hypothetical protein
MSQRDKEPLTTHTALPPRGVASFVLRFVGARGRAPREPRRERAASWSIFFGITCWTPRRRK